MTKSRVSRRALLAGAAPLIAAGPLAKLALGQSGEEERVATHLGGDHSHARLGHAAMIGLSDPSR